MCHVNQIRIKLHNVCNYLQLYHSRCIVFTVLSLSIGVSLIQYRLQCSLRSDQMIGTNTPASGVLIWNQSIATPAADSEIAITQALFSNTHLCDFVIKQQYKPGSFGARYQAFLRKYIALSNNTAPPYIIEQAQLNSLTQTKTTLIGTESDLEEADIAYLWASQDLAFPDATFINVDTDTQSIAHTYNKLNKRETRLLIVKYDTDPEKPAAIPTSFTSTHAHYILTAIVFKDRKSFSTSVYAMSHYNSTWYLFNPKELSWYISLLDSYNIRKYIPALSTLTHTQFETNIVRKHHIEQNNAILRSIPENETVTFWPRGQTRYLSKKEVAEILAPMERQYTVDQIMEAGALYTFRFSSKTPPTLTEGMGLPIALFYEPIQEYNSTPEMETFNEQMTLLSVATATSKRSITSPVL